MNFNMKRACGNLRCMLSTSGPSLWISDHNVMSSKLIRQEFIDYFCNSHDHKFIRSSPVIPFGDPTVPFVNAGMNQFKSIFLGQSTLPYSRVVNSQKCIRVGGKHNDLESVGHNCRHHTFFEMLGSWSFGDYFKEKACRMAWDLLTGPYKLDPKRLYVTYFEGDEAMGIEPDFETQDIWQKIGVQSTHILARGTLDNFWEMGVTGPCGPCTEIYYNHLGKNYNVSEEINSGKDNIIELWNLVFIQYNREEDGTLSKLPCHHIDTGMGFERLVAILQGKHSNYDTDLFWPLFKAIEKISGATCYAPGREGDLNINYRILADHARMVTVALADGVLPDQNPKLRRVLRRALGISKSTFGCKRGLVKELSNYVAESLADAYPEVAAKLKQVQLVINHEEDLLDAIQKTSVSEWKSLTKNKSDLKFLNVEMMPGVVPAYRELENFAFSCKDKPLTIPSEMAYKLYDTYGLNKNTIQCLCLHHNLNVDLSEFDEVFKTIKLQSRENHKQRKSIDTDYFAELFRKHGVKPTDDKYKYLYYKEKMYVFPPLECEVQLIINGNEGLTETISGKKCGIILNRSNMYHKAGGQSGDTGKLILKDGINLKVNEVINVKGHLLHMTDIPHNCKLKVGDKVTLEVIPNQRLGNMRNHTATHLLNAALRSVLTVTCQKSSHVTDSSLMFEFSVYGEDFSSNSVAKVEDLVQSYINNGIPVIRKIETPQKLQELYVANQITLLPGEVYSHGNIYIIEIEANGISISREACCGTHVWNTKDIEHFCVTSVKAPSAGVRSLWAVTGIQAENAKANGNKILTEVKKFTEVLEKLEDQISSLNEVEELNLKLHSLRQKISSSDKYDMSYVIRSHCLNTINELGKRLKNSARIILRQNVKSEMQEILERTSQYKKQYIAHFLQCSSTLDSVPLQKATNMCSHLPILLLAREGDLVKGRCCVPKAFITKELNAKLWMKPVLEELDGQGFVPRGQDETKIFNMKNKYVRKEDLDILMSKAVNVAKEFIENALHSK